MPYSQEELQANEHYTSIKNRDEVKYQQDFVNTKNKWLNTMEPVGSKDYDTLRTVSYTHLTLPTTPYV